VSKSDAHCGIVVAEPWQNQDVQMSVRHSVENLCRRGNIFYWRPRIPTFFTQIADGSRLSLSLRCSDHRKAQIFARQLNTRLAGFRFVNEGRMTTKAQLNQLFITERDEMIEHMEGIAAFSKRYGHPNDELDAEMDLGNGWAYRLLEYFGTALKLTLDSNCQGYNFLLSEGVAEDLIPVIRGNYLELYETSNQRGWKNQIRLKMRSYNIEEGAPNETRSEAQLFKARADVLLDIKSRYPLLDADGRRKIRKPPANSDALDQATMRSGDRVAKAEDYERKTASNGTAPDLSLNSSAVIVNNTTAEMLAEINPNIVQQPTDAAAIAAPTVPSEAASSPASNPIPQSKRRILPVNEFESECDKLITNMGNEWEASTANDVKALVRMFVSVLEEHSVTDSGQIEQFHIGMLRQHFNDIPTHWGKSTRLKTLSAPMLRLEGTKMRKEAEAGGKQALVGLAAATIRKHFANLQHFLKHLKGHGYAVPEWSFDGLSVDCR
jgi:hypothetical protein